MAGTGKTAFSHAAEVHYALPEGDEWSFNAWAPRVIGNDAYVPLCHYSGVEGDPADACWITAGTRSTTTSPNACSSACGPRSGSVAGSRATETLAKIVEEEQRRS